MTDNNSFQTIKKEIISLVNANINKFKKQGVEIEEIKNSEDCYRIIFHFNNCMAQIIVDDHNFSPYRFVCFEVIGWIAEKSKIIYYFYDDSETDIEEILFQINKGFEFASNYS